MKKSLVYALMIVLALSLTAIGCQKVETESTPAPVAVEVAPAAEVTETMATEGEMTDTTATDTMATDTTATDTMATDTTTPPAEK